MRAMRKTELEGFKRLINLTEYAAAQGYVMDRKASSRNSITMWGPGDDKIIVGRDDASGHWIYFSVRDDRDCGTFVDFVQNRDRLTLKRSLSLRPAYSPSYPSVTLYAEGFSHFVPSTTAPIATGWSESREWPC
ncbi:MAG: hypothetical protein LC647_06775 [Beggiatoa sp.]|nr:hypothetical protein [Beggiatoa sp.]